MPTVEGITCDLNHLIKLQVWTQNQNKRMRLAVLLELSTNLIALFI